MRNAFISIRRPGQSAVSVWIALEAQREPSLSRSCHSFSKRRMRGEGFRGFRCAVALDVLWSGRSNIRVGARRESNTGDLHHAHSAFLARPASFAALGRFACRIRSGRRASPFPACRLARLRGSARSRPGRTRVRDRRPSPCFLACETLVLRRLSAGLNRSLYPPRKISAPLSPLKPHRRLASARIGFAQFPERKKT